MDSGKRTWLYAGLALAAGVGLVMSSPPAAAPALNGAPGPAPGPLRPRRRRLATGARVLLVGDSLAEGLAPPLRQLAKDAGILFASDARRGSTLGQWAKGPWLNLATEFKPTLTLVALGAGIDSKANLGVFLARIRAVSPLVWIKPPAKLGVRDTLGNVGPDIFHSEALVIPRGPDGIHPTLAGYAGLAGAVWRWIG